MGLTILLFGYPNLLEPPALRNPLGLYWKKQHAIDTFHAMNTGLQNKTQKKHFGVKWVKSKHVFDMSAIKSVKSYRPEYAQERKQRQRFYMLNMVCKES